MRMQASSARLQVATDEAYELAEGPVWDAARGEVWWVDILGGDVHGGPLLPDGTIRAEHRHTMPGSAGTLAVGASGDLVVAGSDRLHRIDADGRRDEGAPVIDGGARRFNDGKPDPRGRMVVGTKAHGGGRSPESEEVLLRFETDGSVTVIDDDLTLANGLGWTGDGRLMYTVDTLSRRVFVREYDPETGACGQRRVFLDLDGHDGYPDGLTVDTEDHLWVAMWGGGCVLRVSPTGRVIDRIDVPAPHVSSIAFAGQDLSVLVITTAREDLTTAQLDRHPLSGRLFTMRTAHRGVRSAMWNGIVGADAMTTPEGGDR